MSEETTLANSDAFLPANVSDAAAIIGERLKIAFTVAINNPRKETECWERIQKNCRNPKIAETSEYSVRRGRDIVRGPSIRFAEMVLREWGNIFPHSRSTISAKRIDGPLTISRPLLTEYSDVSAIFGLRQFF